MRRFLANLVARLRASWDAFRDWRPPGDAAEHPLLEPSRGFIRSTLAAWLIAFGGTALGIWLAIRPDEIKRATTQAVLNIALLEWGSPQWPEIVFWLACMGWAWLLYRRLQDDDKVVLERTTSILHAIHKVPNIRVVKTYAKRFFNPIIASLGPLAPKEPIGSAEEIAVRIRNGLTKIAQFTREFANNADASYGANVMLVAGPADFGALQSKLRFVADKRDTASLKAILYLPDALLVRNLSTDATRQFPLVALPVPQSIKTTRGNRLALPGAPSAALGDPSVHMDTRTMADDCGDMGKEIVEEIRAYFGPGGEGKDVRSFASFRLGPTADDPIGVLNIDSNGVCVLGESDEFYITFYALLEPFIAALAIQVREYAHLAGPPKANG